MTTRKHFIAAAQTVSQIRNLSARKAEADKLSSLFASQNPRFDKARFLSACGL